MMSLLRRPRLRRGITRFELMAVVAFAGTVGLGASVFIGSGRTNEDARGALTGAKHILYAAEQWRYDHDADGCPTITQLIVDHRLDADARTDDPWGNRYRILCKQDGVVVSSAGKDGTLGTRDDISVGNDRSERSPRKGSS